MSHHELDNPAWHALTGPHAALALGAPPVLRYPPDVSPFMAFEGGRMPDELAAAGPPGETGAALAGAALEAPPGFEVAMVLEVLQMVADDVAAVEGDAAIETLSPADADEMLALTDLTRPGPFARRTIAMGDYFGIRAEGRLIAMAGQRLNLPRHREVSAVCTHPDHLGRGHARRLVSEVARRILAEGKTPFLHVVPGNESAIAVYRKLGFAPRRHLVFTVLRRLP